MKKIIGITLIVIGLIACYYTAEYGYKTQSSLSVSSYGRTCNLWISLFCTVVSALVVTSGFALLFFLKKDEVVTPN
jgi:hypothetical protein